MRLPVLTGNKIFLRQLRRKDNLSIKQAADNKEISQFIPFIPTPYSLDNARRWINKTHREARADRAYQFGISSKEEDRIIGMIGLKHINLIDGNAEIEYWVGRKYWGKGITSEAIGLILNFAFKDLRLIRVYAFVSEKNPASIRVLEKSSFSQEAIFRKAYKSGPKWYDVFGYGILKNEFEITK